MASSISSIYIGKGNMNTRGYAPILYNREKTQELMKEDESYWIGEKYNVSEQEGRSIIEDNIRFEFTKIPERKPRHFYAQQPHIMRYIPPIYNDVYKLDVDTIKINEKSLQGDTDHLKNESYLLRDDRLIDIASHIPQKMHGQHTIIKHERPLIINPTLRKLEVQNTIQPETNTRRFDRMNRNPVIAQKDIVDYTRKYIPQSLHGNPRTIINHDTIEVERGVIDMRGRRINTHFKTV